MVRSPPPHTHTLRTEKQLTAPADRPVRDPAHTVAFTTAVAIGGATSRHGLRRHPPQAKLGSPGSRARCFRTCPGSVTAQGPVAPRDIGVPGVAFRLLLRRRHPKVTFRGSIPDPHVPLSTLHPSSCERRRITRGSRRSLALRRMTLSFTTTLPVFSGPQEVKMILKEPHARAA